MAKFSTPRGSIHESNTETISEGVNPSRSKSAVRFVGLAMGIVTIAMAVVVVTPSRAEASNNLGVDLAVTCYAPAAQYSFSGSIGGSPGQWVAWKIHTQNLSTGIWYSDSQYTMGQVKSIPSGFGGTIIAKVVMSGSRYSINGAIKVVAEVRWHDAATNTWSSQFWFSPGYYSQYWNGIKQGNTVTRCAT